MAKKRSGTKKAKRVGELPGVSLEKAVARIQQMMDPNTKVTHNEVLVDRVGNKRQFDVVIRGTFGGRPILGIVECRDHSRKKGPDAVEAFAKKCDNLGANLRLMVSKKGFTEQALTLARHEGIGCLSLLPTDPNHTGLSVGQMWYGVVQKWVNVRLTIYLPQGVTPPATFDSAEVKWHGQPIVRWFIKELLTTHGNRTEEGPFELSVQFKEVRNLEIADKDYPVQGVSCQAERICRKKKHWTSWTGDALFDWHESRLHVPAGGKLIGSAVETDLSTWDEYDGELPDRTTIGENQLQVVFYDIMQWDDSEEVIDLTQL